MSVRVRIPAALRAYTGGESSLLVEAKTVGDALHALAARHAGVRSHVFDEAGKVRGFIGVYLNDQDVRGLSGDETPVSTGDTIVILPSVAGGNGGWLAASNAARRFAKDARRFAKPSQDSGGAP